MAEFLNTCRFVAGSSGTGSFLDGAAETGFRNLEDAGAVPGATYSYRAESADRTEWEDGRGTYIGSPSSLSRDTVLESSNAGNAVNFSSPPIVMVVVYKQDMDAKALHGVRLHTAAGNAEVRTSDRLLIIKKGSGADTDVDFPTLAQRLAEGGHPITIKDGKGDADVNPIIPVFAGAELCEGDDGSGIGFKIDVPYGWRTFVPSPDGTEWLLVP